MYEVAIIGGGVQGSAIFQNLPPKVQQRSIIIDRNRNPLHTFFLQCKNVGMKYLRSPATHELLEPIEGRMLTLSSQVNKKNFEGRYYTPSVKLFHHYTQHLFKNIHMYWRQATVEKLEFIPVNNSWDIFIGDIAPLSAQRIILALGLGDIHVPEKYQKIVKNEKHVLHYNYLPPQNFTTQKIAVIGGGMSGSQTALSLSKAHDITLITGGKIKMSYFDSNPGFIGPKHRHFFEKADRQTKESILIKERYKGSINPYVYEQLNAAYKKKFLKISETRVETISPLPLSGYRLKTDNQSHLEVEDIVFATGQSTISSLRYNPLISQLMKKYGLQLSNKTHSPLLKSNSLEWFPNLFLSGNLGELTLGPASGSIIGVHLFVRKMRELWKHW